MPRTIVLHSCRVEDVQVLGTRLAMALGLSFELVQDGARLDAGVVGSSARVFGVGSEWLLDRERRIHCLNSAMVIRVGHSIDWGLSGGQGNDLGVSVGVKARLNEIIGQEFDEAHATVALPLTAVDAEVERLVRLVKRDGVCVGAWAQSYVVEVGRGILESVFDEMDLRAPVALYLTDQTVDGLHGARLRRAVDSLGVRVVSKVLPPGEETKSLDALGTIFEAALEGGIDRSSWVIAAGGGVVTDISGLVASLWMRGLKWLGVPTTLLSMVDASVGGKTAVDFGMGKNAVGAFWQPSKVVCDVDWLVTESERNYLGALSEVVKTALIGDVELFELLEREVERVRARDLDLLVEVVRRCVRVKARVVGLDARESGLRATLNLGHTVGHALEALGEYRRYTHGEAVSLGLVAALRLGERFGHTSKEGSVRIEGLLGRLGLPTALPVSELAGAAELLGHDKKRAGSRVKFVFVRGVGDVRIESMVLEDLREAVIGLAT